MGHPNVLLSGVSGAILKAAGQTVVDECTELGMDLNLI